MRLNAGNELDHLQLHLFRLLLGRIYQALLQR